MKYTKEQVAQAMENLPALWAIKHQIKNEAGLPITFDDRRWAWDMYNDLSQFQVTLKPPQVGSTVKDIIKSFWVANKLKKDIIYTLPTASDVNDMAGGKINRIIAQNPILKQWVKDKDTVEQKGVGDNIIYYRGTFSAKQAMMVSSYLNIHDEVDSSDASVITQYETRLQAKANGMRWYFSHPSLSGHGVDIYWQQSDKKEWWITCAGCTKQQILSFPDNIDMIAKVYICSHCKKELTNEERNNGVWKNQDGIEWTGTIARNYQFSGWHISQMMCLWISAAKILEAKADPMKDEQYFWNYVLGLPYVGSENKIDPETVLKNVTSLTNTQSGTIVIGVDTGLPIHYSLMNKEGVFYFGECSDPKTGKDPYDELESLLKRFPKSIMISDQGGDLIGIRRLQSKYPGRVFLVYYRKDRKTPQMIKWGEGNDYGTVVVDRNRMIQMTVESLRDIGTIRLNGTVEEWKEYAAHFGNIYRVAKETPFGVEWVWERSGPDHKVHTLVYCLVGLDKHSDTMAVVIGGDPLATLPTGRFFQQDEYSF
jgi:Phage terminase large subunit (GpA)